MFRYKVLLIKVLENIAWENGFSTIEDLTLKDQYKKFDLNEINKLDEMIESLSKNNELA